ncbi:MAG: hypothetical protein JSR61_09255 [Proteobacteria bacterium]|nr:hypothetical protein [Pseudomonadota bacterium]
MSALLLASGLLIAGVGGAFADKTKAELQAEAAAHRARGACQGAYPGWLRGVVAGYTGSAASPVTDASFILDSVPTPDVLQTPDERLGWGDGLQEGFKAGVAYGVELGKAARTPNSNTEVMNRATEQLHAFITNQCGGLIAPLDWDTTMMNNNRTLTITSLNETQLAMTLAATVNQIAVTTENLARCAREAEAKGDQAAAMRCRAEAKSSAQLAANLNEMVKSHAAQREEAVQAVNDAQASAEKARKAADDTGG